MNSLNWVKKLSKHKYLVKHLLNGKERKYHADRIKIFSSTEAEELEKHEFLEESEDEDDLESEQEEETNDSDSEINRPTDVENQSKQKRDKRFRQLPRKNYDEGQYTFFKCIREIVNK